MVLNIQEFTDLSMTTMTGFPSSYQTDSYQTKVNQKKIKRRK